MTQSPIRIGTDPRGVATVTLDRPAVHNAFDDATIAALAAAFADLARDPALRVLVLRAEGRSFSAGADLEWMRRTAGYAQEENLADARRLGAMLLALAEFPHPSVALVQGSAFGGGVGLVACCDVAIASERARFALTEVRLGLIPATISPFVVAAIGPRAARRLFLTAERFDAAEAARLGLVHAVVAADALEAEGERVVETLLANGPEALAAAKRLVADVAERPVDAGLMDDLAARIAERRASAEGREGIAAFLDKRAPAWPHGSRR